MTISRRVQQQFFASSEDVDAALIRLPPTLLAPTTVAVKDEPSLAALPLPARRSRTNLWTVDEDERFLQGLELFRHGPWKAVAAVVGTKTSRQTMTHAQKYRQKIERHKRVTQAVENAVRDAGLSPAYPANGAPTFVFRSMLENPHDDPAMHLLLESLTPVQADRVEATHFSC